MMLDGAAPPSLEPVDPTWYLILDLVGTWLGAIGTLAATGIAVALAVRAARDQHAQRDEQQRIQAERVVVMRVTSASRPYLLLRNESDQTINTVRAYAVGVPIPDDFSKMPGPVEVLRSGQEKKWYLRGVRDRRNVAAVEFDDALGRTWVRTAEGALHRTRRLSGVNTSEGRGHTSRRRAHRDLYRASHAAGREAPRALPGAVDVGLGKTRTGRVAGRRPLGIPDGCRAETDEGCGRRGSR